MAGSYREARQYERTVLRERGVLLRGAETLAGFVTRLGGGGVFFETEAVSFESGDEVLVRFRLPCFEEPLVVKAEVRWVARPAPGVESPGVGLAFRDLEARKRSAIVEWVAERGAVGNRIEELVRNGEADLAKARSLLEEPGLATMSLAEIRARVRAMTDRSGRE